MNSFKDLVLRPSGIGSFFDCQYRWYRSLVTPRRWVGVAAHLGTGVHKAAEVYYTECIDKKGWLKPTKDFKGLAIDTFREKIKEEEPNDIKEVNLNELEKTIATNAMNYVENSANLNKGELPIAVEKKYEWTLNSPLNVKISGTLDIVGDKFVGDIKTMSKAKNPGQYVIQQATYGLLRQKMGEQVDDLLIHRVILPKNSVDVKSIIAESSNPFITTEALFDRAKVYIESIVRKCEEFERTGNEWLFVGNPNSMFCSKKYCAYYDDCKYRKDV